LLEPTRFVLPLDVNWWWLIANISKKLTKENFLLSQAQVLPDIRGALATAT
jgi:hypothetical protein